MRFVTAFDRHVSLCINRIASLDEFLHRGFGITFAQQRARVAFHHPAHQDRQLCPKPDRNAVFPHALARLGVHVGATARREHLRSVAEQARNDLALAVAKLRFSVIGENLIDALGGRPFDLVVGIDERQSELERQTLADRRLAAAHQADQHDGALAQALLDDLDIFGFRHLDLGSSSISRANRLGSGVGSRGGFIITRRHATNRNGSQIRNLPLRHDGTPRLRRPVKQALIGNMRGES